MLVLSRKVSEQIIIDGQIKITVLSIQGNQVRIGIIAPSDVPVDRGEVHERRVWFENIGVSANTVRVLS